MSPFAFIRLYFTDGVSCRVCPAKCFVPLVNSYTTIKYPQKNGGYPLVSPFVGHCRLWNVAFCFHSFVFYRRRFLPSFAPQSVFVPLANSYTTIKYPQKNGGYPLVSPFVLHCFMCSNYFVLSCLFFSILSFCPLVSFISAFRNPFVLHNSLVTNVPKPFYRVYKSRVSLGNCKITLAISERNAKRLQKEIYYSTLKT